MYLLEQINVAPSGSVNIPSVSLYHKVLPLYVEVDQDKVLFYEVVSAISDFKSSIYICLLKPPYSQD